MTSSVWKGPFVDITLLKKAKKLLDILCSNDYYIYKQPRSIRWTF